MALLKPSQIHFTHTKISNKFTGCGKTVNTTLQEIVNGKTLIDSIPKIKVFYFNNGNEIKYLSENNRRLWVFKQLESIAEKLEFHKIKKDNYYIYKRLCRLKKFTL